MNCAEVHSSDSDKSSANEVTSGSSGKSSSSESVGRRKPQTWFHAWYHTTTSVLGAVAVAALPFAFGYLGWFGGIAVWIFSTAVSYYSGRLLIQIQGTESTYSQIADRIMGDGFAKWWIRPFQFIVVYQVTVLTALTLGQTFFALDSLFSPASHLNLSCWTIIGGGFTFLIALCPSLSHMWQCSFVGSLAVIAFVIMTFISCILSILSRDEEADFGWPDDGAAFAFGVMDSFGVLAFSYGGHAVLPDLQASLRSATVESAHASMHRALIAAYAVIVPCYFAIATAAYAAFGSNISSFLLDDFSGRIPDGLLASLQVLLAVNTLALGAIYIQSGFSLVGDMIPSLGSDADQYNFKNLLAVRFPWVATATFVAVAIPFIGDLAALSGAIGFTAMTFVFPFVLWENSPLARDAPVWRRVSHALLAGIFALLGLCSFVGSVYIIIQDSSTYKFF
ncbi:GAT1 [Symbiodinium pilosum]|uniref:GAT1 protein n=1 Tax=Symbiodinium pilosum TaxID=2952 RepID=A0A812IUW7_SYMPI|nr:GAT1 [Symbiodinium pilosum]